VATCPCIAELDAGSNKVVEKHNLLGAVTQDQLNEVFIRDNSLLWDSEKVPGAPDEEMAAVGGRGTLSGDVCHIDTVEKTIPDRLSLRES
jgi:hypothetical protein